MHTMKFLYNQEEMDFVNNYILRTDTEIFSISIVF